MAATRADVARRAGVSPSTVTYVLTGKRSVSQETQRRVRAAVEELGYQPNSAASTLASRSVRSVGILLRMERDSVESGDFAYIDGVRESVEPAGLQVVVPMGLRSHPTDNLQKLVRSQSIDSAILMDVSVADEREEFLLGEQMPTVLIGTSERVGGAPSIDADFPQMSRIAVEHLAALGHRRILVPMRSPGVETARAYRAQRIATEQVMRDYGMSPVFRFLPDNAALGGELVRTDGLIDGCTAVLGNNPAVLTGIRAAASAVGLRVPDDFSLMAFAGGTIIGLDGEMVTEAGVNASAMGRYAGQMLLRRIEEPHLYETLLVPASIMERGSTGPAPLPTF